MSNKIFEPVDGALELARFLAWFAARAGADNGDDIGNMLHLRKGWGTTLKGRTTALTSGEMGSMSTPS